MALWQVTARLLAEQRGHLFLWVPLCLAAGIGWYFAMDQEPSRNDWIVLAGALMSGLLVLALLPEAQRPILMAPLLIALGFALAGQRVHLVAAPVLDFRFYGPIQGRIVAIDRSASGAVRLTLDHVWLARVDPEKTPGRVRVSLHGKQGYITPEPGQVVILTGHLAPPSGPVEPGGFDFQRHAWFQGIGAVGYTRTPVLLWQAADPGPALFLARLRGKISGAVQAALPGEAGAFAAAIMTGDRSGIGQDTLDHLRASNLSHLLAISGLHMGLLTGFVFGLLRLAMALWPRLALNWPTKKIAALGALAAGAAYLALSGGNVATERAFIMVAVAFGAVLTDRRVLTLRAVAV
ncbi:MAG: ComEC family competence protein, partial [Paracoccaceae bacterium]|nr:ComEC family competence protein [Paracoccaceae bacterium]